MPNNKVKIRRFIGILLIIGISILTWFMKPIALQFDEKILTNLPTMFGYLVLISLFVERTIEVFLSTWRSSGADELDGKLANLKKRISEKEKTTTSTSEIESLKEKLEGFKMERTLYRAESRHISHWLGLGIGWLVALVGVRVLGNIVNINSLTNTNLGMFNVVDIFITGAVLAGGSEAINKIMKVYNNFMSSTADKQTS